MNNKILIVIGVLVVLGIGGFYFVKMYPTNTTAPSTTNNPSVSANTVIIENYAFNPATITVKVGDTVTWTNKDSMEHTASSDDGTFDTGLIKQGKSGTVTFSKAGTYTYHCTVHHNMKGTVIVQ